MRSLFLVSVLAFAPALVLAGPPKAAPEAAPRFAEISVEALASQLKAKGVKVFDANSEKTRAKYGVIPGAARLDSSARYDVAETLPADKGAAIVFYCSNPRCAAAPIAAERAVEAGYTQVSVLRAGIKGWVEAGQSVEGGEG